MKKTIVSAVALTVAFVGGFVLRDAIPQAAAQTQGGSGKVYELRTYTANEGKLEVLHSAFKNDTMDIFAKHGMTNVIYFRPTDPPLSQTTMIYLLSHESREAAAKSWAGFRDDPEWKKVSAANGPMASKVESVFLQTTDYSPMK